MKKVFMFSIMIMGLLNITTAALYGQRGQGAGRANAPAVTQRGGVHAPNTNRTEPTRGKPVDRTVATALESKTELSSRLQLMLPQDVLLSDASAGFKNLGQFVATLHVSQNLEIPFDELKKRMTGEDPMSLGQAIHDWNPELTETEVTVAVTTAETQATEIQTTETQAGETAAQ